jgi:hypothetical protein
MAFCFHSPKKFAYFNEINIDVNFFLHLLSINKKMLTEAKIEIEILIWFKNYMVCRNICL